MRREETSQVEMKGVVDMCEWDGVGRMFVLFTLFLGDVIFPAILV
jgi:hypothetical protein